MEIKVCPNCGSISIVRKSRAHRKSKHHQDYDGEEGNMRMYTCKVCYHVFSKPSIQEAMARQIQRNPRLPKFLF